jgi:hypothetical protein
MKSRILFGLRISSPAEDLKSSIAQLVQDFIHFSMELEPPAAFLFSVCLPYRWGFVSLGLG